MPFVGSLCQACVDVHARCSTQEGHGRRERDHDRVAAAAVPRAALAAAAASVAAAPAAAAEAPSFCKHGRDEEWHEEGLQRGQSGQAGGRAGEQTGRVKPARGRGTPQGVRPPPGRASSRAWRDTCGGTPGCVAGEARPAHPPFFVVFIPDGRQSSACTRSAPCRGWSIRFTAQRTQQGRTLAARRTMPNMTAATSSQQTESQRMRQSRTTAVGCAGGRVCGVQMSGACRAAADGTAAPRVRSNIMARQIAPAAYPIPERSPAAHPGSL